MSASNNDEERYTQDTCYAKSEWSPFPTKDLTKLWPHKCKSDPLALDTFMNPKWMEQELERHEERISFLLSKQQQQLHQGNGIRSDNNSDNNDDKYDGCSEVAARPGTTATGPIQAQSSSSQTDKDGWDEEDELGDLLDDLSQQEEEDVVMGKKPKETKRFHESIVTNIIDDDNNTPQKLSIPSSPPKKEDGWDHDDEFDLGDLSTTTSVNDDNKTEENGTTNSNMRDNTTTRDENDVATTAVVSETFHKDESEADGWDYDDDELDLLDEDSPKKRDVRHDNDNHIIKVQAPTKININDGWKNDNDDEFDLGNLSDEEEEEPTIHTTMTNKTIDQTDPIISHHVHINGKDTIKMTTPVTEEEEVPAMTFEERRAKLMELEANLYYMKLWQTFDQWKSNTILNSNLDFDIEHLLKECRTLVDMMLYDFPSTTTNDSSMAVLANDPSIQELYNVIWMEYTELRQLCKSLISEQIQYYLKEMNYPSPKGCTTSLMEYQRYQIQLQKQNERRKRQRQEPENTLHDESFDNADAVPSSRGQIYMKFQQCCIQCIQLQQIHEHYYSVVSSRQQQHPYQPYQRLDVITELVRPIVIRVQYHFLQAHHNDGDDDDNIHHRDNRSSNRLIDWFLTYLKEECVMGKTTTTNKTPHAATTKFGPLELIRQMIDTLSLPMKNDNNTANGQHFRHNQHNGEHHNDDNDEEDGHDEHLVDIDYQLFDQSSELRNLLLSEEETEALTELKQEQSKSTTEQQLLSSQHAAAAAAAAAAARPPPIELCSIYFVREILYLGRSMLKHLLGRSSEDGSSTIASMIMSNDVLFGQTISKMFKLDECLWEEICHSIDHLLVLKAAEEEEAAMMKEHPYSQQEQIDTMLHYFFPSSIDDNNNNNNNHNGTTTIREHDNKNETWIPSLQSPSSILVQALMRLQHSIPRLSSLMTLQDPQGRLQRWIELEYDASFECLSLTKLPFLSETNLLEQQRDSPRLNEFVETTIGIIQSLQHKCEVAFAPLLFEAAASSSSSNGVVSSSEIMPTYYCLSTDASRCMESLQLFVQHVTKPFVEVAFINTIRTWAKSSLKTLQTWTQRSLSQQKTRSTVAMMSSAISSSGNIGDSTTTGNSKDISLIPRFILQEWCRMMVGLRDVAKLLGDHDGGISIGNGNDNDKDNDTSSHQIGYAKFWSLHSLEVSSIFQTLSMACMKLSKDMLNELSSSLIEWWMVDDPHVASYMMRLPTMLQHDYFAATTEDDEDNEHHDHLNDNDNGHDLKVNHHNNGEHNQKQKQDRHGQPTKMTLQKESQRNHHDVLSRELVEVVETIQLIVGDIVNSIMHSSSSGDGDDSEDNDNTNDKDDNDFYDDELIENNNVNGHIEDPNKRRQRSNKDNNYATSSSSSSEMACWLLNQLRQGIADKILEGLYSFSDTGLPDITNMNGTKQVNYDITTLCQPFFFVGDDNGNSLPSASSSVLWDQQYHQQPQAPGENNDNDRAISISKEEENCSSNSSVVLMGRLLDTVHIMSWEDKGQARSLRDTLRSLVMGQPTRTMIQSSSSIIPEEHHDQQRRQQPPPPPPPPPPVPVQSSFRAMLDRMDDDLAFPVAAATREYDPDASYQVDEHVLMEARSILKKNTFQFIDLNDALHVLNQRCDL